nr:ABC-F family ATP-binding cassette domain-containing protein [Lachnospiraceae bacterium]
MILQVSHINKTFNSEILLKDISFHINKGDKVALIGNNGCGKTTLLKIINHREPSDSGDIIMPSDVTIGYVEQNISYDSDKTIHEELLSAKEELIETEEKLNKLNSQIENATGQELDRLVKEASDLHEEFSDKGGFTYRSEVIGVMKGLGFNDEAANLPVNSLSGGEKTRVALGKVLLNSPDIIILDEPTNHLDINSISWLENYLASSKSTILIVSHDRFFLNKIVNKVVEIHNKNARLYTGNYDEYATKKQQLMESEMKAYLKKTAEIMHQEKVIEKLKSFNREKSIKRAESREKMLKKMEEPIRPEEIDNIINLSFSPRITGGNDVLSVESLKKSFDEKQLFNNLSFEIKRGERVAIIGDNGTGKTTLLKIINNIYDADSGKVTLGTDISIGYYDQAQSNLDDEKTVFDELHDAYPDMNNTEIRNTLAAFLFKGEDVFKEIKMLSGGEKGRLSLAKLMLSNANLLILDEPTNHLDIDGKQVLERALNNYTGTVLFVSHDRYFVNRVATRILELRFNNLLQFIGNYDYYLEKKEDVYKAYFNSQSTVANSSSASVNSNANSINPANPEEYNNTNKSSFNALDYKQEKEIKNKLKRLNKELKDTEKRIAESENELSEIDAFLSDPANGNDAPGLLQKTKDKEQVEEILMELMDEWEKISEEIIEVSSS